MNALYGPYISVGWKSGPDLIWDEFDPGEFRVVRVIDHRFYTPMGAAWIGGPTAVAGVITPSLVYSSTCIKVTPEDEYGYTFDSGVPYEVYDYVEVFAEDIVSVL